MAQRVMTIQGGKRETADPVASVELMDGCTNMACAYAADGFHLGNIGYRPYQADLRDTNFLFLC